jgi:hypothetical protein
LKQKGLKNKTHFSRPKIAPIEVKILLRKKLFFAGFSERPAEVPDKT